MENEITDKPSSGINLLDRFVDMLVAPLALVNHD
jgi:hypothetical protein